MKNKFKKTIVKILTIESSLILNKFKPEIIAVTGNIGKTTTKDFIYQVLKSDNTQNLENIRAAAKSENSEFGVCLTIIGEKNAWNNIFAWFKIITFSFLKTYFGNLIGKKYPKILILEIGADHPGDIKHITSFVKPKTVVLTAFQNTPTHGEFFANIDEHIREKKYLVDALIPHGNLIFNADDEIMSKFAHEKKEQDETINLFSFGKFENSNVQILESNNFYNSENEVLGTKVKIKIENQILEIDLHNVLGEAQNYSLAAAILVGILQNKSLQDLRMNFQNNNFIPTNSRMRILKGINNTAIIDDSYNASPKAVENALNTLQKTFTKGKKILILGHMAELGEKTKTAHIEIGQHAAEIVDIIVFSGSQNEYYLEGVRQSKFPLEKVFLAKNSTEVIKILNQNNIINTGDLILIKGSQSARLEKVVIELLFEKGDRKFVCRQDKEWEKR